MPTRVRRLNEQNAGAQFTTQPEGRPPAAVPEAATYAPSSPRKGATASAGITSEGVTSIFILDVVDVDEDILTEARALLAKLPSPHSEGASGDEGGASGSDGDDDDDETTKTATRHTKTHGKKKKRTKKKKKPEKRARHRSSGRTPAQARRESARRSKMRDARVQRGHGLKRGRPPTRSIRGRDNVRTNTRKKRRRDIAYWSHSDSLARRSADALQNNDMLLAYMSNAMGRRGAGW